MTGPLPSWNDTGTRQAILRFVESVTDAGGAGFVPPAERVAVFDNDGTLWCEKPMPIELAGMDVEDYQAAAHAFLHSGRHPTLGSTFAECGYAPMIELLEYLTANGFTCYIASGGDRDFMQPITEALYGIPSERVIGNSNGDIPMLAFAGGPSRPGLRLLVLHDDPEREFDYVTGSEQALEQAKARDWTVVSIKRDWATVFARR
jgi:hypothetical protein